MNLTIVSLARLVSTVLLVHALHAIITMKIITVFFIKKVIVLKLSKVLSIIQLICDLFSNSSKSSGLSDKISLTASFLDQV